MNDKEVLAMTWLNNHTIIKGNLKKEKPCKKLGWCPYGQLVEAFPLKDERNEVSCKLFGHDCPMFYHAEDASEDKKEEVLQKIADRRKN